MLRRLIWFALPFALLAVGCGIFSVGSELVRSHKPRDTSPDVASSDLDAVVTGNTQFALDLYHALCNEAADENIFFSPHSISVALAMTYAGARGETARQMAAAVRFYLPPEQLHPAFNALDIELARRSEGPKTPYNQGLELHVANSLWAQREHHFLSGFLDLLAENYGAGVRLLDFRSAPHAARAAINDWGTEETQGQIQDLAPADLITSDALLVLANAVYLNAPWQHKFQEQCTRAGDFNLLDGTRVTVNMMSQTMVFRYTEADGYQVLELPYDGGETAMVVVLPRLGCFHEIELMLGTHTIDFLSDEPERQFVRVTIPRFDYAYGIRLKSALSAMGMPLAFSQAADFSRMTDDLGLYLFDVVHKATIHVDEEGTVAAAGTLAIAGAGALDEPVAFTADRPFIFLIRDLETGAILFLGRVLNPLA